MLFTTFKYIYFLAFLSGFVGPAIFVKFGGISIFPYRLFIIMLFAYVPFLFVVQPERFYTFIRRLFEHGWFFLIWFVYAVITLFWARSFEWAFSEAIHFISFGSLLLMSFIFVETRKDVNILFGLWIIAFILSVLVGLWEIATGNHLITSKFRMENFGTYRLETFIVQTPLHRVPTAFFYNQNNFATFLSLSFSIVLFYRYNRLLKVSFLLLGVLVLVFTLSRANYLAFALMLIILPFFLKRKYNLLYIPSLFLLGVIGLGVIFFVQNTPVISKDIGIQRIYYKFRAKVIDFFKGGGRELSASIRKDIILSSLEIWQRENVLGLGMGQLEYYLEERPTKPIIYFKNMHNWFLELLVKYGIFIFIIYMLFWLWVFLNLMNNLNDNLAKALLISIVCFLPASISPSTLIPFYPHWAFYILIVSYIRTLENS